MTTAADWPPRPPDRIVHKWSCCHPPGEDHYTVGKDGRQVIVKRCPSCGSIEKPAPSWRST